MRLPAIALFASAPFGRLNCDCALRAIIGAQQRPEHTPNTVTTLTPAGRILLTGRLVDFRPPVGGIE